MKTTIYFLTLFFLIISQTIYSQYFQDKSLMYFSNGIAFDFDNIDLANPGNYPNLTFESNICQLDADGNMLFYVAKQNGDFQSTPMRIFDGSDNLVTDEWGGVVDFSPIVPSSIQMGASVPSPAGNVYNLIVNASGGGGLYQITLRVVNGIPYVVSPFPTPILPPNTGFDTDVNGALEVYENTAVIPHRCNNYVFWILATTVNGFNVVYQLDYTNDPLGIVNHVGTYNIPNDSFLQGSPFNVSPTGEVVVSDNIVYSFDRTTGTLVDTQDEVIGTSLLPMVPASYNFNGAFSRSGKFYYNVLPNGDVYRWDVTSASVLGSAYYVGNIPNYIFGPDLILAPDGLIYLFGKNIDTSLPYEHFFTTINNPDADGIAPSLGSIVPVDVNSGTLFTKYIEAEIPGPPPGTMILGPHEYCEEAIGVFNGPVGYESYSWTIIEGDANISDPNQATTEVTWSLGQEIIIIQLEVTDQNGCLFTLIKEVARTEDCTVVGECLSTFIDIDEFLVNSNNIYFIQNIPYLYINEPIEIPSGHLLFISFSNLYFGPNGSISVSNAAVSIDGSILTRAACNDGQWIGIIGDNTGIKIQDSEVSYAEVAVDVNCNVGTCNFQVEDNIFQNNNISFLVNENVGNIYTPIGGFEFENNQFISNDGFNTSFFLKFNKLKLINPGIITGNLFLIPAANNTRGIHISNFKESILSIGLGNSEGVNIFSGLNTGVALINTEYNSNYFRLGNNTFGSCNIGIRSNFSDRISIEDNHLVEVAGTGIILLNTKSYNVSQNYIEGATPVSSNNAGLVIRDTPSAVGSEFIINDNDIIRFKRGLLFRNYQDDLFDIDFSCNRFRNNTEALRMVLNSDLETLTSDAEPSDNVFENNNVNISVSLNSTLSDFYFYNCTLCTWFNPFPYIGIPDPDGDEPDCNLMEMRLTMSQEKPNTSLTITPNPNNGQFDIVMEESMDIDEGWIIQIYNNQGSLVKEINGKGFLGSYLPIDLSDHPAGIYMVQLKTDEIAVTKKIVITK